MNAKLKRCNSFGVGFDEESDVCAACGQRGECIAVQSFTEMQLQGGAKPYIPIVAVKSTPEERQTQVEVSRPLITNEKVTIIIRFDKNWLKKVLGWDFGDDNNSHNENNKDEVKRKDD